MGNRTTCLFKLYSLSRISYFKPPSLSSLPHLPVENVGRMVDEKLSGVITTDATVLHNASKYPLSSDLFFFASPDTLFKVKSIFTHTRWWIRRLHIEELLRLWDYPDNVISALSGRHRKVLWDKNSIGCVIALLVITS